MKLIHLKKLFQLFFSKALTTSFLVILLTACGTKTPAGSAPAQSSPGSTTKAATSTPAETGGASDPLKPNAASLSIQQGNLLIQSHDGLQCPYHTVLGTVTDQLVLASDRTTYSQAEIAQMQAYYQETTFVFPDAGTPTPPPTLRWVLGGSSVSTIPEETTGGPGSSDCGVILALTNTGNTPIQIPKVGIQLTASPQQNTYQYRLINTCSFLPSSQPVCLSPAGGGGDCTDYDASIQLGQGEKNAEFSAIPTPSAESDPRTGQTCQALTLAPSAQDQLTIDFSLAPNTPKNLIYSVVPVFTVDTTQGVQTLALSQLTSRLAFAGTGQFSCYTLQKTSFVPVQMQSPSSEPTWCI